MILSPFYKYKRIPRKLKKKYKKYKTFSKSSNVNVYLWEILEHINPEYKKSIIIKICLLQ